MNDYMIRATAADGQIRAFAATTRDMVEIEILEEGAKGLFGILGGKDAKVAVTLKPTPASGCHDGG